MHNIEIIFEKLFDFYQVGNMSELAKKIDTPPTTISKWKQRKSINAIKKKCIELGIYKKIFEPNSSTVNKSEINRALYSFFPRSSLAYLYYLLKKHDIKNSEEFFEFQAVKDEESDFKKFIGHFFIDLSANIISVKSHRQEFLKIADLYLDINELDFILRNKEVFISSIYSIMHHQLKSGVGIKSFF